MDDTTNQNPGGAAEGGGGGDIWGDEGGNNAAPAASPPAGTPPADAAAAAAQPPAGQPPAAPGQQPTPEAAAAAALAAGQPAPDAAAAAAAAAGQPESAPLPPAGSVPDFFQLKSGPGTLIEELDQGEAAGKEVDELLAKLKDPPDGEEPIDPREALLKLIPTLRTALTKELSARLKFSAQTIAKHYHEKGREVHGREMSEMMFFTQNPDLAEGAAMSPTKAAFAGYMQMAVQQYAAQNAGADIRANPAALMAALNQSAQAVRAYSGAAAPEGKKGKAAATPAQAQGFFPPPPAAQHSYVQPAAAAPAAPPAQAQPSYYTPPSPLSLAASPPPTPPAAAGGTAPLDLATAKPSDIAALANRLLGRGP